MQILFVSALAHCQSPPLVLNVTGPETLSVREIANEFGRRFESSAVFSGNESDSALLNNASKAIGIFGLPIVTPQQMMDWIAHWVASGRPLLNKPTHFEVQDGKF